MQINTVWRGACTQDGCDDFGMIMEIKIRKEDQVEGMIYWTRLPQEVEERTKFKGTASETNIQFEEYENVTGLGLIPFPNNYEGSIDEEECCVLGKWTHHDQSGMFYLDLDVDLNSSMCEEPSDHDISLHSSKPAKKSGILIKRGGLRKNWLRRFFILNDGVLNYYKFYPAKSSGKIDMIHVTAIKERNDILSRSFMFQVITSSRSYLFQAESKKDQEEWIEALTTAHAECKKLTIV